MVVHTKRGQGVVRGFYGEFVLVQFDDEPHGQHKYTWDQAHKKVSIIGYDGILKGEPGYRGKE